MAATVDVIAPSMIIIPTPGNMTAVGDAQISGALIMSGASMYVWASSWKKCDN